MLLCRFIPYLLAALLVGCSSIPSPQQPTPKPPAPAHKPSAPAPTPASAPSPAPARSKPEPASVPAPAPESAAPTASPALVDAAPASEQEQRSAARAINGDQERGIASWYGPRFHGRRTANGERFDTYALTAAHKTLPFGTRVRVTSLLNGREVIVRINDRGPFIKGRIIDLSHAAAQAIGLQGVKQVALEVLR